MDPNGGYVLNLAGKFPKVWSFDGRTPLALPPSAAAAMLGQGALSQALQMEPWRNGETPETPHEKVDPKKILESVEMIVPNTLWWTNILPWKITMLLMEKSTISMAIFHCFLYVHQAGYMEKYKPCSKPPE